MTLTDDIELNKIDQFVKLADKQVLEVGCGDGRLTAFLVSNAGSVTGIDTDQNRIDTAKTSLSGANFLLGSGEALCFPQGSFDLVLFGYALHHQDGSAALAEAQRVLRPGGEILIIEPTVTSEYTQLVAVFEKEEPALLTKAKNTVRALGHAIARQETFTVPHFFDTEEMFLDHYVTSYGHGAAEQNDLEKLRRIIGNKRYQAPICVEDQCTITLLSGNNLSKPHPRTV